jgi:hypothetical protein
VKVKKANNKKKSQSQPLPHCGDFQKMTEMMKTCCPGEGEVIACCSMMRRMMGHGEGAEAKETTEPQRAPRGGENG